MRLRGNWNSAQVNRRSAALFLLEKGSSATGRVLKPGWNNADGLRRWGLHDWPAASRYQSNGDKVFLLTSLFTMICMLWMAARIWKSSPILAIISFFFLPAAIIPLIQNWGDEES